jgi:hypothetical protein
VGDDGFRDELLVRESMARRARSRIAATATAQAAAVLDAERANPGANITNFVDSQAPAKTLHIGPATRVRRSAISDRSSCAWLTINPGPQRAGRRLWWDSGRRTAERPAAPPRRWRDHAGHL